MKFFVVCESSDTRERYGFCVFQPSYVDARIDALRWLRRADDRIVSITQLAR